MADVMLPPELGVPITWGGTVIDGADGKHHLFVDVCCYTPTTIMVSPQPSPSPSPSP